MATIKDVAKRAGVSISTVSLAINHKQGVSDEVLYRVEAAMRELHYRPSISAQNLRKKRFHIIGVVLPSLEGHYTQILQGIYDALDTTDVRYDIIVKVSGNRERREAELVEELIAMSASGIIMVPCARKDTERYSEWQQRGVLIVFLERALAEAEISSVCFNDRAIVYRKTRELLQRYSWREMALVTGYSCFSNEKESIQGFLNAVEETADAPDASELRLVALNYEWRRSVWNILEEFGNSDDPVRCILTTSGRFARILNEVVGILRKDVEVYSLGGDVLFQKRREETGIREIPRKADLLGKRAAELLLENLKTNRVSEVRNITIESEYPVRTDVRIGPQTSGEPVRLKALFMRTNEMEVLTKLAPNFMQGTGIDIDFTLVPFDRAVDMLTGPPEVIADYDLFWVDIPLVGLLVRQGKLEKLSPLIEKEGLDMGAVFPRGVLKSLYADLDQIYGLPLQLEETLLYYRRSAFQDTQLRRQFYKQNGFELAPPSTWPEYNIVARFFDRRFNPASPFSYGTAMALLGYAFMEEFYIRQWAFNGRFFDKQRHLTIDSIENIRALKCFKETYKTAHPDSDGFFFDETYQALLNGEVPMIINFPVHCIPFLYKETDEDIEQDIRVARVPGGRSLAGGWELCVNTASAHKEEAFRFIRWAVREDLGTIRNIMGSMLPVKSTFGNALLEKIAPELNMMDPNNFSRGMRESIRDSRGDPVDQFLMEEKIRGEMFRALRDEKTAEEVLGDLSRKMREVIGVSQ